MKASHVISSSRFVLLLLAGSGLALVGCSTVGPEYQRPAADLSQEWRDIEAPALTGEFSEHGAWWTAFNDPALSSLIESAYQQNLTVRSAAVRILQARAQLGIANGHLYPQQQRLVGGIYHTSSSKNQPNTILGDLDINIADVAFDVAWEIDVWGKIRRGIESADAAYLASAAAYDALLVSLVAGVGDAYTLIRTFEQHIEIARENVGIQERSIQIADVRFRNETTTELDVQQAKSLLAGTQAAIPRFQIGLRQAQNALDILLGITPGQDQIQLEQSAPIPSAPATVAVGVPADLLRRRPDVKQAELQAAAQAALIGVSKAELFPVFALTGALGLRASDGSSSTLSGEEGLDNTFSSESGYAEAGAAFSWPLFNYGRLKNEVRVQDARYQQLLLDYENTVLQAAREAEDAMTGFLRSREEVAFLSESQEAARRAVDLALIQYREGATDYTTVLNTQQALLAAQDQLTTAQGEVAQYLIALYKSLGGGWQIRKGRALLPEETESEMSKRTSWGRLLPPDPTALDRAENEFLEYE